MRASRGLLASLLLLAVVGSWLLLRDDGRGAGASYSIPSKGASTEGPLPVSLHQPPSLSEEAPVPEPRRAERESEPVALPVTVFEELDDEVVLQVRVLALESGQPLRGVPLRIEWPENGEPVPVRSKAPGTAGDGFLTDEVGRADLIVPAGSEFVLQARPGAPLGRSARRAIQALGNGQYRTVVLELFDATDRSWCGLVVDGQTGAPVPNAAVTLMRGGSESLFVAEPGGSGFLCLELDSLSTVLKVEAPRYGRRLVQVEEGHARPSGAQRIELLPSAVLEVFATDVVGRPLHDLWVSVSVVPEYDPDGWRMGRQADFSGRTDEEGRCLLSGIPPGQALTITGRRPNLARVAWFPEGLLPSERRLVRWALGNGHTLSGQVVDQDGGALAGLELWLSHRPPEGGLFRTVQRNHLFKANSDTQGDFLFEDVTPGTWWLGPHPVVRNSYRLSGNARAIAVDTEDDEASARDCAPVPVPIEMGAEDLRTTLRVSRGLYIRGRVVDPWDEPCPHLHLHARNGDLAFAAMTNIAGAFRLGPLVSGEYQLTWEYAGAAAPQQHVAGAEGLRLVALEMGREAFEMPDEGD